MDVRFSPEQLALRDSVAQVVAKLGPKAVRDLEDVERAAKLDAAIASSGWRDLRTADEDGAPWASAVEATIVAEELGRGLADAPFLGPTLAAELRRLAGATAATAGETVVMRPRLDALARVGDAGVAIDAAGAETAVLLDAQGLLVAVAVSSAPERIDLTRPSAAVGPAADPTVLGGPLDEVALGRWTALGLALTTADLVGTMHGALQLARDYAVERRQYGAAIGSFQAVQHLLADALVAVEGARSAALHAAWAVDALAVEEAVAAGAIAKAYAARAARSVCETAIQVHGGIGNTWDCLAHVHLRRVLLATDVLGGVGRNLGRVLAHHDVGAG